jgi:hypothetical protein
MAYRNRLMTIGEAIKKAEYKISDYEREINYANKRIDKLKIKRDGMSKLLAKYPDARYNNGDLYLEGVGENWDKVAGMSVDRVYDRGYRVVNLAVKFSLNKKYSEGVKIFMVPPENVIAQITSEGYGRTAKGTIKILDYKSIIPEKCTRRKAFIRRIKYNLLDRIKHGNLTILDDSFDKEEFLKLMLLK